MRLPDCALAEAPTTDCLSAVPAGEVNDLSSRALVADVDVEPEPGTFDSPRTADLSDSGVFAMSSMSSGPSGDFAASPLSGSDKWQVGVSSGSFSYGYPIPMPPTPAGPVPELALGYSSQAVDGRSGASNGQPSQVGEGWSFHPGFIERRFTPCSEEGMGTQDLCMGSSEWYLNLNGRSSEIVRGIGNEWRLRDDAAWRVQNWTGGFAGSSANDYFTVMTPDGTKYWFGLGKELTSNVPTNSAFNVPVYGNHAGEACNVPGNPSGSWCYQTWRFNLDRIQDRNANVATLFWTKEQNRYGRYDTDSASTVYDRGGFLARVEYGMRNLDEGGDAPAKVTTGIVYRCAVQENCPPPSAATASSYPDVPLDLMCTSATSCAGAGQNSPSFWSTYQVASVSTFTWNGMAYEPMDKVELSYSFPTTDDDPNDGYVDPTTPSLWLRMIARTGFRGAAPDVSLPAIGLTGTLLPNRVDHWISGGVPKLNKYRVGVVKNELGATTTVAYGRPHVCPSPPPATWDDNPYDCYPQWTTNGASAGWAVFNKYQVLTLEVDDSPGPAPNMLTRYTYNDNPAWHYDDSLVPGPQTWSDYRGHSDVFVETMTAGGVAKTTTRHFTFRGMNGDKGPGSAPKSEILADSEGAVFVDHHYLAGYPMEERVLSGTQHLQVDLHRYWAHQTVVGPVGYQQHAAQYVRESSSVGKTRDTAAPGSVYRRRQVDTTYDTSYGLPVTVDDNGDPATGADDTCVSTARTVNVTSWLLDFPHQTHSYSGNCGSATMIGKTDTYYDESSSLGAAPVRGNLTAVGSYPNASFRAISRRSHDAYGRVRSTMTPNENAQAGLDGLRTVTNYFPATGLPIRVEVTNPRTHLTKTELALGMPFRLTDQNLNVSAITRDGLGRVTEVLRPGDTAGIPSLKHSYSVGTALPSRVMTSQLLDGSRYVNTFTYVDGLGRVIETQAPSPSGSGRVVTATRYDDQGQVAAQTQPVFNSQTAGANVLNPVASSVPYEQRFTYDALGRQTAATQFRLGAEQWRTTTSYTGLTHTVNFPVRTDVTYHTDAFGRTSRVVERPVSGQADTVYTYTPAGQLDTITDDAGNVGDFGYDWLGRRTSSVDPDQGSWSYTYDPDGNQVTSTDGLTPAKTLTTVYDILGRRTEVKSGATQLARWSYDTATKGIGLPTSSTRVGNGDYTVATTGYDGRGRPTGRSVTLPVADVGAGNPVTYAFGYGYDRADHLTTLSHPPAGGLSAEVVTTAYSDQGMPSTTTGASTYVASTTYFGDGRMSGRTLGASGWRVARNFEYDDPAGRLSRTTADLLEPFPPATVPLNDVDYDYDADGNLVERAGPGSKECFRYEDGLNRLTKAFTTDQPCSSATYNSSFGVAPYQHTYVYDDVGNMTGRNETVGLATLVARTYTYPTDHVRPHAVESIGGDEFEYDGNGAMSSREDAGGTTTYGWDDLHRLVSVTAPGGVTTMSYDADGNRLVRRDPGGVRTIYLDGMELRVTGSSISATRYYGSVAIRVDGTGVSPGLWWTLSDSQHSTTLTVNAANGAYRRQRYLPFGGRRHTSVTLPAERGFLGKTEDPTGLDHLGARYHDPELGRFLSVDPILDLAHPQSLNPYSYSRNNPTSMSDPSGLSPQHDDTGEPCGPDCQAAMAQSGSEQRERDAQARANYILPGASYLALGDPNMAVALLGDAGSLSGPELATLGLRIEAVEDAARIAGIWADTLEQALGPFSGITTCVDGVSWSCAGQVGLLGAGGAIVKGAIWVVRTTRSGPRRAADEWPPAAAGEKIPGKWGPGRSNNKGEGSRWQDPQNPGNGVRIDRGNPNNSQPSQQVDHVVVRSDGRIIGRDGKPIKGPLKDNYETGHIPLDEWLTWTTWYKP